MEGQVKLKKGGGFSSEWHVRPVIAPVGIYTHAGGSVNRDGFFTLKGLPPGTVRLVLINRSEKVMEKTVHLPVAESKQIVFEVP